MEFKTIDIQENKKFINKKLTLLGSMGIYLHRKKDKTPEEWDEFLHIHKCCMQRSLIPNYTKIDKADIYILKEKLKSIPDNDICTIFETKYKIAQRTHFPEFSESEKIRLLNHKVDYLECQYNLTKDELEKINIKLNIFKTKRDMESIMNKEVDESKSFIKTKIKVLTSELHTLREREVILKRRMTESDDPFDRTNYEIQLLDLNKDIISKHNFLHEYEKRRNQI